LDEEHENSYLADNHPRYKTHDIAKMRAKIENANLINKYPWYPAQEDALINGVPRPRSPQWKQIEDQLGSVLQRALIGQLTAEEAVKEAQSNISSLISQ
jgi:multiple sugar transport system substrate-binding protein